MDRAGAFAAPGLFELLYDRVAATRFPSRRLVASAAMSATTVDQLDRLAGTIGRQMRFLHVSPRAVELLGIVVQRRMLLDVAGRIEDRPDDDAGREGIEQAVDLLRSTSQLLQ